jgi:hypothetical protein
MPADSLRGGAGHRGPLRLPRGRRSGQLRDPLGVVWGFESH